MSTCVICVYNRSRFTGINNIYAYICIAFILELSHSDWSIKVLHCAALPRTYDQLFRRAPDDPATERVLGRGRRRRMPRRCGALLGAASRAVGRAACSGLTPSRSSTATASSSSWTPTKVPFEYVYAEGHTLAFHRLVVATSKWKKGLCAAPGHRGGRNVSISPEKWDACTFGNHPSS